MMMLSLATLTLGSSTAMVVAKIQAQHATTPAFTSGKLLGITRRQSLSNRTTHSLPMMGLVTSSTNQNCSLCLSFSKESRRPARPFTTAVASVDSDQLSSSDPPTKVFFSSSLPLQPHFRICVQCLPFFLAILVLIL